MNVIRLRKKNICLIFVASFLIYLSVHLVNNVLLASDANTKGRDFIKCSKYLKWHSRKPGSVPASQFGKPIDILGPPGSGVEWFRFTLEQLTGLHTGSVHLKHPQIFLGEGKTDEVLTVSAYDLVEELPSDRAAIVVYRNLQDTVRTHFSETTGTGAFLEAPLQAYYGNDWKTFAVSEGKLWATRYANYVNSRQPILVILYDELEDQRQIQTQLLRLSNFVRVPIKHSALQCIMKHADQFPLKPRPLKTGFQPFTLLSVTDMMLLQRLENQTRTKIDRVRSLYRPNV